jgi:uncharacterized membrane protein
MKLYEGTAISKRDGPREIEAVKRMPTLQGEWRLPAVLLIVILTAGAAVRFHFADANSYWLDELYSVTVYGTAHNSVVGVLRRVSSSIQLPLYPFILYNWMVLFGDSEVATRTLSNLYVVGATVCLYLAVQRLYGAWLGVIVALVFTLMFTPTYYGMETRGYAQSMFLSSLSTLFLVYALPRLAKDSWRSLTRDTWVYALLAANFALLVTHYYNVFFLAAQGLFLIVYLLYRSQRPLNAIAKSFAIGITPVVLLLLTWGPFMIRAYHRRAGGYEVEGYPKVPWKILSEAVIHPNFGGSYLYYGVLLLVVGVAVLTVVRLFRRPNDETLFALWFLFAAVAPAFLAFLLFLLSGHERYSNRYFSFSVGPLAVLVVLGVYQVMTLINRKLPVVGRLALVLTAAITAALVIPGGLYGLAKTKPDPDWRVIAKAIVARVDREPDKRFAVYETTFKNFPTLDYYLARYSDHIRVRSTLRKFFERDDRPIVFAPPSADYAIVAFTHHKVSDFPKTLAILNSKMKLLEQHLNGDQGYLVFSVAH